jgi:multicomponent Na+:H+ antiporter subunit F
MLLLLIKIISFQDKYNKILAANLFTTNVIVFIVFFTYIIDNTMILDIALVYAFINFVAIIGISKFITLNK